MFRVLTLIIRTRTAVITASGTAQQEAVITVVLAPDDGCQHPKHVELSTEI